MFSFHPVWFKFQYNFHFRLWEVGSSFSLVFYIFSLGIKLDFRHLKTLFYYCSGIIDWIILEEDITTHTVVRIMVFRMHSETKFLKKDRDFEIFNLPKFRFEVQIKWSFKLSVSGNMIDLVPRFITKIITKNSKSEISIRKFNNIHGQLRPSNPMSSNDCK